MKTPVQILDGRNSYGYEAVNVGMKILRRLVV